MVLKTTIHSKERVDKMSKFKKIASVALSLSMIITLATGCGSKNNESPDSSVATPSTKSEESNGKVYFLNFKSELAKQYEEVASDFTSETGIEMKVVTAGSGTYEQTLKSEVAKKNPPTLFNVNGPIGHNTWKDYCADLKDSDLYSWLLDKSLAITEGEQVHAIPYAVESYGIIYNDAIMKKYFALDNKVVDISDTKEINNFKTLKAVVEDITANKEKLGIEGVFGSTSFSPGEDWRWQTHLANIPVYYEYRDKNVSDLAKVDFKYSDNFKNIFDLYLNNSIIDKKMVGSKTVEDSMTELALGKVAMIQNGNWGWAMIQDVEGNTVSEKDIKFMPIYTGVEGEEKQGLCTGTENFICVNGKVSEADQKASLDFLEWLFNSKKGKENCITKLGLIAPFSTFDESERPTNPLALEMFSYMDNAELTSVSWNFTTFPSQIFKDNFGASLLEYAQGNEKWENVVDNMKADWEQEKAAINE